MDRRGVTANFVEEPTQIVLGFLHASDMFEGSFVFGDLQLEHFARRLDALEGVTAFVGDAGHHLADAGQPLGVNQLFLGESPVRKILADGQDGRSAFKLLESAGVPNDPPLRAVAPAQRRFVRGGRAASKRVGQCTGNVLAGPIDNELGEKVLAG